MGWTNITDDFRASNKHRTIAMMMGEGWDAEGARALGVLAFLWGNSQAAGKDRGTREEIILWSQLYQAFQDQTLAERWIETLCRPGIEVLEQVDGNLFRIVGNKRHIDRLRLLRKNAAIGGRRSGEKRKKSKTDDDLQTKQMLKQNPSKIEPKNEVNTRQFNAIQGNAIQGKEQIQKPTAFDQCYWDYPLHVKGQHAEKRFNEQIKTPEDERLFRQALTNYKAMLAHETWRRPKQTFAAFLGTKATGFFWRDFITWEPPAASTKEAEVDEYLNEIIRNREKAGA